MKNVYLAKSNIAGTGVFAARHYRRGQTIMSFMEGQPQVVPYSATVDDPANYVQIGIDSYIYPYPPSLYINHSCNPNAGLQEATEIIALTEINRGTELTFDYSTSMADDPWEMNCVCGEASCRGRILEFKHLPIDTQLYYMELGVVPDFCIKPPPIRLKDHRVANTQ
jgi:SET domain-containing protein